MTTADELSTINKARNFLARLMGYGTATQRDPYGNFGWPPEITIDELARMYRRNGVGNRIIRAFPQATWRERPTIKDAAGESIEEDQENFSPFAKGVWDFFNKLDVLHSLEVADRVSSIGHFGILYMGFRDGVAPDQPRNGKAELLFLQSFSEARCTIAQWVTDKQNPRYGLPQVYQVKQGRTTVAGIVSETLTIHASRVLHIAEQVDDEPIYGIPRLEPVYNHLLDLEKVIGSSAETYWMNSSGRMVLTADKDANFSETQLADMKQQSEELENQLRRTLALQGVTAQMLQANANDPSAPVDKLMDLIAGGVQIPKRILIGSERGELSSNQDENNWAARIDERQNSFATPMILKPFIQIMIDTGNVPQPNGEWEVEWPDSSAMTPEKFSEVGQRMATTLSTYVMAPGAEDVVPIEEFRTDFLGLPARSEYMPVETDLSETDPNVRAQFGDTPVSGDVSMVLQPAQISALTDLLLAVADGSLPDDTVVSLIQLSFAVSEEVARAMVDPVVAMRDEKDAERAANPPPALPPPAPGQEPEEPDPEEDPQLQENIAHAKLLLINALRKQSAPRSLYVRRDVMNPEDIRAHFKAQGLGDMVPPEEMHVTIMYSRRPVDWMMMGSDMFSDQFGNVKITAGGPRLVELFGPDKNVLVLTFANDQLKWRNEDMRRLGASWDWPDFQPHITLTYKWPAERDIAELEPYAGVILLGPEIFEEIDENFLETLTENSK